MVKEKGHTGCRRPIGRRKLQVIFRKKATCYRALLRKMTYQDKASYGSSPPCTHIHEMCLFVHSLFIRCMYSTYVCMCIFRIICIHILFITCMAQPIAHAIYVLTYMYMNAHLELAKHTHIWQYECSPRTRNTFSSSPAWCSYLRMICTHIYVYECPPRTRKTYSQISIRMPT